METLPNNKHGRDSQVQIFQEKQQFRLNAQSSEAVRGRLDSAFFGLLVLDFRLRRVSVPRGGLSAEVLHEGGF